VLSSILVFRYKHWTRISNDQNYAEHVESQFRWKKSHIRNEFLRALGVQVDEVCFFQCWVDSGLR
jgi:hypothetical protein